MLATAPSPEPTPPHHNLRHGPGGLRRPTCLGGDAEGKSRVAAASRASTGWERYALYLMTFAISSVGGVFGGVFLLAAGILASRSESLLRSLTSVAVIGAISLLLQGFGLGGLIAPSQRVGNGRTSWQRFLGSQAVWLLSSPLSLLSTRVDLDTKLTGSRR